MKFDHFTIRAFTNEDLVPYFEEDLRTFLQADK